MKPLGTQIDPDLWSAITLSYNVFTHIPCLLPELGRKVCTVWSSHHTAEVRFYQWPCFVQHFFTSNVCPVRQPPYYKDFASCDLFFFSQNQIPFEGNKISIHRWNPRLDQATCFLFQNGVPGMLPVMLTTLNNVCGLRKRLNVNWYVL